MTEKASFYQTITDTAKNLFNGGSYLPEEKELLVEWILDHQNRFRGFIFYPSETDRKASIRLISGELPRTKFLSNYTVEMETLRLLSILMPDEPRVHQILLAASERLLPLCFANGCSIGECAHASIAFQRFMVAFDPYDAYGKIHQVLAILRMKRSGDGKWQGFPFYFTLLLLAELPQEWVKDELSYVRKYSRRRLNSSPSDSFRKIIIQKALA